MVYQITKLLLLSVQNYEGTDGVKDCVLGFPMVARSFASLNLIRICLHTANYRSKYITKRLKEKFFVC